MKRIPRLVSSSEPSTRRAKRSAEYPRHAKIIGPIRDLQSRRRPTMASRDKLPCDGFRRRARAWHLTYRGHVPRDVLLAKPGRATSIAAIGTLIVHEPSDAEVPYPHTHFAWLWQRAPNLHGARLMDVEVDGCVIHPHAVQKKSLKWLQHVFQRYHVGTKSNAVGRPIFVAPVAGPWQFWPSASIGMTTLSRRAASTSAACTFRLRAASAAVAARCSGRRRSRRQPCTEHDWRGRRRWRQWRNGHRLVCRRYSFPWLQARCAVRRAKAVVRRRGGRSNRTPTATEAEALARATLGLKSE